MTQSAKEFLRELSEHPPEPKKCACGCNQPLTPRFDGGRRPTLDGKEINEDCRDRMLPAFPNHGTPGIHGPGVAAHLDPIPDDADIPPLGGHARGHGSNLE